MKKLVNGIVEFRRNLLPDYRKAFAKLALGQAPDALFIGCCDSRVAVNVFASTEPGDLFVIRNVGNLVPPCGKDGKSTADESEAAAIEFALSTLKVSSIIVCGHSECGAMQALASGRESVPYPNLRSWLRHAEAALEKLEKDTAAEPGMSRHNRLSQLNVLSQIEHLKTYPLVRKRLDEGLLSLHAWWFELSNADVYAYEETILRFVIIDEFEAMRILARVGLTGNSGMSQQDGDRI